MAEKEINKRRKNHRHQPVSERNLLTATLLNFVITIVEIAGGILSNSLALLSDALQIEFDPNHSRTLLHKEI